MCVKRLLLGKIIWKDTNYHAKRKKLIKSLLVLSVLKFSRPKKTVKFHMKMYSGISYDCNFCKKSFSSQATLNTHTNTHEVAEAKEQCKECKKMFSTRGSLKRHTETIHKNEKN